MNNADYSLGFYEALKIVLEEGGSVKGENFASGIFMRLSKNGMLAIVDANKMYKESSHVFLDTLVKQKFRRLNVMTLKSLEK